MNFYVIKSTEQASFELDKTKLSYPAYVMDLRTGETYVLETIDSDPIKLGGKEMKIYMAYFELDVDGSFIGYGTTLTDDSSYTHIGSIMDIAGKTIDQVVSDNSIEKWSLLPLSSDAVVLDNQE